MATPKKNFAKDSEQSDLFWRLANGHLQRPGVEKSTMMGSPCLRSQGDFYAMIHRGTGELIVKLPAKRVLERIGQGDGTAFQPAGRVFREWLAVAAMNEPLWMELLDEAQRFAKT